MGQIDEMLSHEMGSNQSMEAIMFSVVVETWIAFETLAADLWFTALDHGPAEWRNRVLLKSSKFKKGDDLEFVEGDPSKMSDVGKKFGSHYETRTKFHSRNFVTLFFGTRRLSERKS